METGGREGDIQAAHESVRTLTWLLRDRKPWKQDQAGMGKSTLSSKMISLGENNLACSSPEFT